MALSDFSDQTVTAMAGIGHPDRFFDALRSAGLKITEAPLPDHHAYSLDDLPADPATPVFVTSKDAVKLRVLGELPVEIYEVVVQVVASESLLERLAVFENSIARQTTAKRV
jgi:tetraacyldisaccharide 4'-kinase